MVRYLGLDYNKMAGYWPNDISSSYGEWSLHVKCQLPWLPGSNILMLEKQHNNKNKSSVELKAFYAAAEAEVGAVA